MNTDAFYQTMAAFCFTLVGLWWAVVQFRHEEWMADPAWRRLVHSVHLSFLVPGVMSLAAIIAGDIKSSKVCARFDFPLTGSPIRDTIFLSCQAAISTGSQGKERRGESACLLRTAIPQAFRQISVNP